MERRFADLDRRFDLLVVGGGIYGAWTAYDAALRGLSVALVERTDWAAGTSSASSKLIHGGLRYLEYGHVGLVRKALRERSRLLRLAPHRVRPLRFTLPVWRDSRASRALFALGLTLYDLLAGDLAGAAPHRAWSREALLERCPWLAVDGLRGGFAYADAGEDDARFTLEIVAGAAAAGATCVNHAEVVRLLGAERGEGALVRDTLSGAEREVRAGATVVCAGPWAPGLLGGRSALPVRMTKGVHLTLPPLPAPLGDGDAMLLTTPQDRRVFFLIPWYGATLLGTTDTDFAGAPEACAVTPEDVAYLLRAVRARCPGLGWSLGDVRGAFAGLRTLQAQSGRTASAVTREWTLAEPRPGVLAPVGGKFTSARVEAAQTVARASAMLGRGADRCPTDARPFPWAPAGDPVAWLHDTVAAGEALGLDPDMAATLARRHGAQAAAVHALLRERPRFAARIHPDAPFCLAEALHAVRHEMARDLDDVLRRRVPVAILARLARTDVTLVAQLVAPELGWDAARAEAEAVAWWRAQARARVVAGL